MTTPTRTTPSDRSSNRAAPRPTLVAIPARREYRERDFGVGYGRSSGYASDKRYASNWTGPTLFRCG